MGLIATELVINALKHAFPDQRGGKITVAYRAQGATWTLSVTDDGVGMSKGAPATSGLGTSIVQALARQLMAQVELGDMEPGTKVSLVHTGAAPRAVDVDLTVKEAAI